MSLQKMENESSRIKEGRRAKLRTLKDFRNHFNDKTETFIFDFAEICSVSKTLDLTKVECFLNICFVL